MKRIHRKLLIALLIFLDPIPIPTPALSEDEFSKAIQSTQALSNALNTFTPLAVLALGLLCVLAAVLIFGRKKSDIQPLINSNQRLMDSNQKLMEKMIERDGDREDKHQEAIEALAITDQEVKAILIALNTRDMQSTAMIGRMVANAERQTSALEVMVTKGSTPVQNIALEISNMRRDGIKPDQPAQDQLDRIESIAKEINQKAKDCKETDEVLAASIPANELLVEVNRNLELFKRWLERGIEDVKQKSKPIPAIAPDEQAGSAAA